MSTHPPRLRPILATLLGIALFSAMDATLKGASIAIGAYSAYFLRCVIGFMLIAPVWWLRSRTLPRREVMRLHIKRGVVVAFMGLTFFHALVRLPLAEAIAISFIAPLIALYLAAVLLGETIHRNAIFAGICGLAGVLLIVSGRFETEGVSQDSATGIAAILLSAVLYAWNLVLQRQQALVARPEEISTFQNGVVALLLLVAAPVLLVLPDTEVLGQIVLGAVLAVGAVLALAWAYARAEAQVLVPIEYTGFLWAVLFGWLVFDEAVTRSTLLGAALIIFGCLVAARRRPEQSAL